MGSGLERVGDFGFANEAGRWPVGAFLEIFFSESEPESQASSSPHSLLVDGMDQNEVDTDLTVCGRAGGAVI